MQIDQQYYAALKGCTGESAGTTALAALVWEGVLYVANAGAAFGISSSQYWSPTSCQRSSSETGGQQQSLCATRAWAAAGVLSIAPANNAAVVRRRLS